MSKHDAAPTHGYVIMSHVNKFIVRLCLLLLAALIIAGITLTARLRADCHDVARYDWNVFGYEVHVQLNKDVSTCTS